MIFHKGLNPFLSECFVRVDSPSMREDILNDISEPCIILSTSGMLNGGPIMEYLNTFGVYEKNTLIFIGYQADGTLGRRIQKGWNEIPISMDGKTKTVKINLDVKTVDGFSGHSDRRQLLEYIRRLHPKPERVITVHGDESNCKDIASAIHKRFHMETNAPKNLETTRLY